MPGKKRVSNFGIEPSSVEVELIYDGNCSILRRIRSSLIEALETAGMALDWQEWCKDDTLTPGYVQQFASTTVLVNGKDVLPSGHSTGKSCRLYRSHDGRLSGIPPATVITRALLASSAKQAA